MRVVVIGASGNVGLALLRALEAEPAVESVLAVARRIPDSFPGRAEWRSLDITRDDLVPHLRGADAVVHLAWAIQPQHDAELLRRTNVEGARRVLDATVSAGAPVLVVASSVGAYSPAPGRVVDESWQVDGIPSSFYSRHKVAQERMLAELAATPGAPRLAGLRPALIFQRE